MSNSNSNINASFPQDMKYEEAKEHFKTKFLDCDCSCDAKKREQKEFVECAMFSDFFKDLQKVMSTPGYEITCYCKCGEKKDHVGCFGVKLGAPMFDRNYRPQLGRYRML
ncbi:hypothetical protein SNEBB_006618 [Seison nebaliae]|nr:hypothetical protein SNEBB_006618 [Seison nebaliae]